VRELGLEVPPCILSWENRGTHFHRQVQDSSLCRGRRRKSHRRRRKSQKNFQNNRENRMACSVYCRSAVMDLTELGLQVPPCILSREHRDPTFHRQAQHSSLCRQNRMACSGYCRSTLMDLTSSTLKNTGLYFCTSSSGSSLLGPYYRLHHIVVPARHKSEL